MTRSHEEIVEKARIAVKSAQDVRAYHRKRTKPGHPQRSMDIANSMQQLRRAMRPIRSALGHAPYDPISETIQKQHEELRKISKELQNERRKLWKLRGGKDYFNINRNYRRKHPQK